MLAAQPFGLFLTWTTYGTWLPGDERGYVSNTLLPDGTYRPKENRVGAEYDRDSARTRIRARQLQKGETVWLSAEQARIVAESLLETCRSRGWVVKRGAVMSNHVHVLVMNCPDDGAVVLRVLKGVTQATLSATVAKPRRWWTRSGSQRYIHGDRGLLTVSQYIEEQDRILVSLSDNTIR